MTASRLTATLVASALALGVAGLSPALGDNDDNRGGWFGGWGMGHMMGRGMGGRSGMGPGGCGMGFGADAMLDRIDGRLAFLKTELKITDAQEEVWDSLATTIRNNAEVHNAMMKNRMEEMQSGEFFKKPLPDRLAMQEAHMESRLQQIKDVRSSLDKLYADLDDSQKKSADEIMLPMMGMGCGMRRGMGGMMRDG
ncbi:MAG: Spy/CpxP family protein refolding chaperone [Anderseniella sp.]|jgi:hypothetical protein|nr:Spy/CpxP family protein refolding chaperone [Anderseniella sp.]